MSVHTLRIDGADVAGTEGQSILAVATENGITIPTMCHLDGLSESGAVPGVRRRGRGHRPSSLPACTTAVAEGMEVTTTSEQLTEYRRTIIEMLFLERNHVCAVCVANNHCELQDLSEDVQVDHFELPLINPSVTIDASATRCSPSTTTAASCACAACGSVARSRAPTPGACMGSGIDERVVTDMGTPVGRVDDLHELRQVRPGLSHRRAVREGPLDRRREQGTPAVPAVPAHASARRRSRHEQARRSATGLARRLFRLPHVVPGHGRAAARDRRAGGHRLQPAGRHQGVPRPRSTSASWRARSSSEDDLHKILMVRERTRTLVSFGDCAVTANVPGMRNPIGAQPAAGARLRRERRRCAPACRSTWCRPCCRWPARSIGSSRSMSSCPAVRRPRTSSTACSSTCSRARTPDTTGARGSDAEADDGSRPDRHRSRSPGSRATQDHDPPRRGGRGDRRPVPRDPVPRLRADRPGPADPRDAVDHGPHLRHLPGQPPGRVVQGLRRDPRRRAAADGGGPATGHEPRPDRPVERAQLLPPRRRPTCCSGSTPIRPKRNIIGVAAAAPAARPRRDRRSAGSDSRSSSGWAASGSIRRGSCPAASTRRCRRRRATGSCAAIPEAIAAIERASRWYKAISAPVGGRGGLVRRLPVGVHGPRRTRRATSTTTTACCASWTPTAQFLADRIDPRGYADYIGEAVEPWSYLKSTYWKALGYPDGVYRVGPLARVIVADQMGTPRADVELDEFRRAARAACPAARSTTTTRGSSTRSTPSSGSSELLRGPGHPVAPGGARRRDQPQRGDRRLGGAARHADPPLPGRRRRDRRVGEPRHRDRPQQPRDEPERRPGREGATSRARRSPSRCSTGSRRSSAATTRACRARPMRWARCPSAWSCSARTTRCSTSSFGDAWVGRRRRLLRQPAPRRRRGGLAGR